MGTCLMSLEGQVKNLLVVVTYLLQHVHNFPSRAILSLPFQLVPLPDDYVSKYACLWGSFLIKRPYKVYNAKYDLWILYVKISP